MKLPQIAPMVNRDPIQELSTSVMGVPIGLFCETGSFSNSTKTGLVQPSVAPVARIQKFATINEIKACQRLFFLNIRIKRN